MSESTVPELSIVLATYNEIDNLPELVREIEEALKIRYEIIFCDDGSKDGTKDFILDYCSTHDNGKYIFSDVKQTTLIARYRGVRAATGRFVVIMDSDLQHPPEKLPAIYEKLSEGYDIVIASRFAPGGSTGDRKAIRGVISRSASLISKLILKSARGLSDPMSNFIGFRRDLNIFIDMNWRGFEIPLCIMTSNRNLKIAEIGYVFKERRAGSSKVTQNMKFMKIFVREMINYRHNEKKVGK
jgi:dolichol-phosphate mannosyltransferase